MAGIRWAQNRSAAIAVQSAARTELSVVAAANVRLIVDEIDISFDGTSSTGVKVLVEIVQVTGTIGGVATGAANPVKVNAADDETLQTTGNYTWTTEPTGTTVVLDQMLVHPQSSWSIRKRYPVKGGTQLGVRCTSSTAINARIHMGGEE